MRILGVASISLMFLGLALMPFSVGEYGMACLAMLMFVMFATVAFWPRQTNTYGGYIFAGLLLCLSQALSMMYSPTTLSIWPRLIANVLGFAVFIYILSPLFPESSSVGPGSRLTRVIFSITFSAATVSAYYLSNFFLLVERISFYHVARERFVGGSAELLWGASNVVASLFIFPFFLSIYGFRHASTGSGKVFYRACNILLFLGLIFTFSRGALLATWLGLGVVAAFDSKRSLVRQAVLTVVVIGCLVVVADTAPYRAFDEALLSRFRRQDMEDLNGRFDYWSHYVEIIAEAPFWGKGYLAPLELVGYSSHNLVLTILADRGIIGLVLSSLIVVAAGRVVVRNLSSKVPAHVRSFYQMVGAGGFAAMLHLMFEDAHYTVQYSVYSWVFLGIVFIGRDSLTAGSARPRGT